MYYDAFMHISIQNWIKIKESPAMVLHDFQVKEGSQRPERNQGGFN